MQVNMKNCGRRNVWKYSDINNSEKYIDFEISLKFGNMNKMNITSSESKYYLGISGKGFITSMALKIFRRSKNMKRQGLTLLNLALSIFIILLIHLKVCLIRVM